MSFSTNLIQSISADEIYVNNINVEDKLNEIENNILDISNNIISINIDFSNNQLSLQNILNDMVQDISSNLTKIFDISQNVLENEIKISDINDLIYKDNNNTIIKRDTTKEIRFYDLSNNYRVAINNSGNLYVKYSFPTGVNLPDIWYNVNNSIHDLSLLTSTMSNTLTDLGHQVLVEIPLLITGEITLALVPVNTEITAREYAFNKQYPLYLKPRSGLELLDTLMLKYDSNQFQLNNNNELQVRGNVDFQTLNTEIFSRELAFYKQYPLYLRPKIGEEYLDTLKLLYNTTQFELSTNNELQIKNVQDLKSITLNKGNLDPSGNSLTLYYNNGGTYFTDNSFNSFVNLSTILTGKPEQPFITVYNRMFKNGGNTAIRLLTYGGANSGVDSSTQILMDSEGNPTPGTNEGKIYFKTSNTDRLLIRKNYTYFYNSVHTFNADATTEILNINSSGINIKDSNIVNFGYNTTKHTTAGRILYGTDSLDIYGGGTTNTTRKISLYDNVVINSNLEVKGNVGMGVTTPAAKLDIYVSGSTGTNILSDATYILKIAHTNLTQGLGFSFNGISANGTAANQDIIITPKGTGKINLNGTTTITGSITASGVITGGSITTVGTLYAGASITTDGILKGGSITTIGGGSISTTGTLSGGTISTTGTLSAANISTTGTLTGGNTTINGALTITGGITSSVIKKRVLYGNGALTPSFSSGLYYNFDLSTWIGTYPTNVENRVLTFYFWSASGDYGDYNGVFTAKIDLFLSSYSTLKSRIYQRYNEGNGFSFAVINYYTVQVRFTNNCQFYCSIDIHHY